MHELLCELWKIIIKFFNLLSWFRRNKTLKDLWYEDYSKALGYISAATVYASNDTKNDKRENIEKILKNRVGDYMTEQALFYFDEAMELYKKFQNADEITSFTKKCLAMSTGVPKNVYSSMVSYVSYVIVVVNHKANEKVSEPEITLFKKLLEKYKLKFSEHEYMLSTQDF